MKTFYCVIITFISCQLAVCAQAEEKTNNHVDEAVHSGIQLNPRMIELKEIGQAYNYDTGYLQKLLKDAPEAYGVLYDARGISSHRKSLPLEAHYVARVATMRVEDCGPCTELNLRMAIEEGVDRKLLETVLHRPEELPQQLRDIYEHAQASVTGEDLSYERADRIKKAYGSEGFAELAVVITGCQMYPNLKRALLSHEKCVIGELDY